MAAGLAAALIVGYFMLPSGSVQSVGYDVVGLVTLLAIWLGVRLNRPADRMTWWLFGLGSLCSVAADSFSTAAGFANVDLSTPSIADALYLLAYPFLIWAVLRLGRRAGTAGWRGRSLDAAIVAVAALALSWHLLMNSYASDDTLSSAAKLTLIAYPIMDTGIVFILVSALLFTASANTATRLVTAAMIVTLVGDFAYDLMVLHGVYRDGMWVDATWLVNYALIGVAALHPSMASVPEPPEPHRARHLSWVALMAVTGLTVPGMLITLSTRHEYTDVRVLAILMSVMVVLAAARMNNIFSGMRRQAARLRTQTETLQTALRERDRLAEDLRHQALHDSLTGLANRELLRDRIEHALDSTSRSRHAVALVLFDLDGFKIVNDSLGHQTGDRLLVSVAARLNDVLRPSDTIARLGGDEFVVLMDDISDSADAITATERMLAAVNQPHPIGTQSLTLSASAGIAIGSAQSSPDQLLSEADAAMYGAKERGRNCYQLYRPALGRRVSERMQLTSALPEALDTDQFHLDYQPIYTLATGELRGLEALARWRHPTLGLISPLRFIPILEETGLIVRFGRWVLDTACRTAARWMPDPQQGPRVGVNVSALQLQDPNFVADVRAALSAAGLPGQRLVLELTESSLVANPDHTKAVMAYMQSLGVQIAIDDFGTGYSSLSQLQRFPVDTLKIDKSFVDRLDDHTATGETFITAIVELAKHLNIATLAEGIETEQQRHILTRIGCDAGQGNLLSPPVSAAQAAQIARRMGTRPEPRSDPIPHAAPYANRAHRSAPDRANA